MSTEEKQKWKSEEQREEREERLAALKSKDGKAPLKDNSSRNTAIIITVLVLIAVALGVWYAVDNGYFVSKSKALKIDDREYTPQELNFYCSMLGSHLNPTGIFVPEMAEPLNSTEFDPEEGRTLREIIIDSGIDAMKIDYVLKNEADKEGYELTELDKETLDGLIEQMGNVAASQGITVDEMLEAQFGPHNTPETVKENFEKFVYARSYWQHKIDSVEVSEEEIEKKYQEKKDEIDQVSFRSFIIKAQDLMEDEDSEFGEEAPEELESEEDKEARDKEKAEKYQNADEEAKKIAQKVLKEVEGKSEDEFKKTAEENMPESMKQMMQFYPDITLQENTDRQHLSPKMAEWLYDGSRKAGDVTLIEDMSGYTILYYLDRGRSEVRPYTSRHILISSEIQPEAPTEEGEEPKEPTEEELAAKKEEAKAKIEEILAEYNEGEKTEEAFAELANKYSEDPGNEGGTKGGLYENIAPGRFVSAYEEFCLEPGRKEGDVEIVEVDYGYHLIYFVRIEDEEWKQSAKAMIIQDYAGDFEKEALESTTAEKLDGMKYVLAVEAPAKSKDLSEEVENADGEQLEEIESSEE